MLNGRAGFPRWPYRLATILGCALLSVVASPAPAAAPEVLVISGSQNPAHDELVTAMLATLDGAVGRRLTLRTRTLDDPAPHVPRSAPLPAVVVTVGTEAAATVLNERPGVPVFCVFLPETALQALASERDDKRRATVSGLFLDQPFVRRLRLVRLALPLASRIGVVLGPDSRRQEAALRQAAATAGLVLQTETIAEERQLVGALHRLLEDTDILLAVPDAVVFNRHTAQSVLLTANGHGKPVAGYSRAYAKAGALLAVYSTAEQVGQQAGEVLLRYLDGGRLPPPQAPQYFSVEVNERVARSLGVELADERTLADRLRQKEIAREAAP